MDEPQQREKCPRDSDWCDGRICVEHGIECPNADRSRLELEEEVALDRYLEAREALEVEHLDSLERSLPPEWTTA